MPTNRKPAAAQAVAIRDKCIQEVFALSVRQQSAAELLAAGKSDGDAATLVGVSRQTVQKWRTRHPGFVAELNRIRAGLWREGLDKLRSLVPTALRALEEVMTDPKHPDRVRAAGKLLDFAGPPDAGGHIGPTDERAVVEERMDAIRDREISRITPRFGAPDEATLLRMAVAETFIEDDTIEVDAGPRTVARLALEDTKAQ